MYVEHSCISKIKSTLSWCIVFLMILYYLQLFYWVCFSLCSPAILVHRVSMCVCMCCVLGIGVILAWVLLFLIFESLRHFGYRTSLKATCPCIYLSCKISYDISISSFVLGLLEMFISSWFDFSALAKSINSFLLGFLLNGV